MDKKQNKVSDKILNLFDKLFYSQHISVKIPHRVMINKSPEHHQSMISANQSTTLINLLPQLIKILYH